MSSFFISEEIKSRINLNNISNNSLIIDNILSLSVFEDKIEVKFNITDMNMLNKNIKVEALIVGEKTINFKNQKIKHKCQKKNQLHYPKLPLKKNLLLKK